MTRHSSEHLCRDGEVPLPKNVQGPNLLAQQMILDLRQTRLVVVLFSLMVNTIQNVPKEDLQALSMLSAENFSNGQNVVIWNYGGMILVKVIELCIGKAQPEETQEADIRT